jgi:uncharacterized protein YdeI (YjbR/CyaY-like superfamily)
VTPSKHAAKSASKSAAKSATKAAPEAATKPAAKSAAKAAKPELPILFFESGEEWAGWLAENHDTSPGVWLRFAKKGSGIRSLTYAPALEEALRYGWIDGQAKRQDDDWYVQKFIKRAKRSIWSKVNRDKVEALIAAGRMEPAGQAEIDRAKADGRWDAAYDSPKNATVPEDLQAALNASPRAKELFPTLSSQNRYAILFRLQTAKKPETRVKRIAEFVAMLERGETLH